MLESYTFMQILGKTKQATLISDFHAHGSKSSLCPIRLARS